MFKHLPRRRIAIASIIAGPLVIVLATLLTLAIFAPARSLTATPKTTAIPTFEIASAVPKWSRTTDKSNAASNSLGYILYQKAGSSCTYTTATYLDGIYYQHRSDFWISKDVLYGSAVQNGTLVKSETASQLKVAQGGSLQFATAKWDAKTVDRKTSSTLQMAARAIDTGYKIPAAVRKISNPSDNGYGLDSSKAIPVLIAVYQCSKPSDASDQEFKALLGATTVNLR